MTSDGPDAWIIDTCQRMMAVHRERDELTDRDPYDRITPRIPC